MNQLQSPPAGADGLHTALAQQFMAAVQRNGFTPSNNFFTKRLEKKGVSSVNREQLIINTAALIQQATVKSTQSAHASAMRCFSTFCKIYDYDMWRPNDTTLAQFVAWRSGMGNAYGSIKGDISKLRVKFAEMYIKVPQNKRLPLTRAVLKAKQNCDARERPKKKRVPLTTMHLRGLVKQVTSDQSLSPAEKTIYQALYCTMFFGFLRVSEAIRGGSGQVENPPLQLKHVEFLVNAESGKKMVVLRLPPCKTDKTGEKFRLAVTELDDVDADICPVRALWVLVILKGQKASGEEDLFAATAHGVDRIKYKSFTVLLCRHLEKAGYDGYFRSHSFRRGAATSAFALGIRREHVKMMGRWTSEVYLDYVVNDMNLQADVTASISRLRGPII